MHYFYLLNLAPPHWFLYFFGVTDALEKPKNTEHSPFPRKRTHINTHRRFQRVPGSPMPVHATMDARLSMPLPQDRCL